MDVATRKRVLSASMDPHAPPLKLQAPLPEQPMSFVDAVFVNLMNALNVTEPTQRLPLVEETLSRLQWLKQYLQQSESNFKKPMPSEKSSPIGSPRQPEFKPMDFQQMKKCIQKDQDTLQNMSRLIGLPLHPPPPVMMAPPQMSNHVNGNQMSQAPKPPISALSENPKAPGPQLEPKKSSVTLSPQKPPSSIPTSVPPPPVLITADTITSALSVPQTNVIPPTPTQKPTVKKPIKKDISPPPPPPPPNFLFNPTQQYIQSAEEYMLDVQERQRKLLSYISAAHSGTVTDEVLHEYLRHPYILLKENGVTRKQQNPFYHLMSHSAAHMNMMPPMPAVILKPTETSKPTTPIPAPPVLVPQVELPVKKEQGPKKESSPPSEKISPPPQLPLQVPLQVPVFQSHFDPTKPFMMPVTRRCNQWSVVSMALPLTLMCRCSQTPCRCK
ncbi:hypothetical protein GCK72_018922 [Caenorhabditis remanei]|uniref:Uncharacterized protein n=1 Tax=Caenorhabditis remanei TaxID=31234 RepID=A0A6A5GB59_CAERE|nr:hypothetical protein GCK72_018922 [Caenorhabditis remanei]KAF1752368.1 hypothetical protein GCK72_018922 [Caenorhabditis remanei]